jgi:hypothetical protein
MATIPKIIFSLSLIFIGFNSQAQIDFGKQLSKKNSQTIVSHLSPSVDIKIEKKQDIYSRKQAEVVINDFFKKHPISSFKSIHQSTSKNGMNFLVGELNSGKASYKLTLKFTANKESEIQSISISTP